MLELELATQFKRDLKKITKQGKKRKLLDSIVEQLQKEESLDLKHNDHNLSVNWDGYRECHITPDWLLIYKIIKDDRIQLLRLSRTG
ncbi:TPA: type II toxin-antitoxin system YafQ family toxin, partial [Legionella pneumophila]